MRTRSWKDDLAWLAGGSALLFGLGQLAAWAKAEQASQDIARTLLEYNLFYSRELLAFGLGLFLLRLVRDLLGLRGVAFFEWFRSSALLLVVAAAIPVFVHLDAILDLLARVSVPGAAEGAEAVRTSSMGRFLSGTEALRWGLDLLGLLLALLTLRLGKPADGDLGAAREAAASGDLARAGDLYWKAGEIGQARKAYRKAKATSRLADLELRGGRASEAAVLYEKAGSAFAWEASRAYEAAGNPVAAARALGVAIEEARASSKWDRLAEAAEAAGDQRALENACRRLAEIEPAGPSKTSLFRRAGAAAAAWGNALGAAEAYRLAYAPALAGEFFLKAQRPADAAREFERAGDLPRAAEAARAAGNAKAAHEYRARAAEAKKDLARAAEDWLEAGNLDRAALLFEKTGQATRAATVFRDSGRPGRAAPLFKQGGDLAQAAQAYEAAGKADEAAILFLEVGQLEKAASLFQAAGRLAEAAQSLERGGHFDAAIPLYGRAGRQLDAARCALLSGHRDLAWENLVSVPRTEPGVSDFFLELAEAHLKASEPRDAVHILREILGPAPADPTSLAHHEALARALEAAGDLPGAVERLAKITAVDPSFKRASDRMAQLSTRLLPTQEVAEAESSAPFSIPPLAAISRRSSSATGNRPLPGVFDSSAPGFAASASGALAILGDPGIRYEIVAELGRGGMGVVHKALDRKLDRFVALKILPATLWGDETAIRYFEREAKAIATLDHPNVVALYDYGEGFGSAYLAMEFLDGPNLQTLLKTDPERIKAHWRAWFVQAARGVAAAHAKGILHRDLKPANLMLDRHGHIRILDFGLARPEADSLMTSKLIGTPAFFPPEVLRGESPSTAGDVYSLGATFYTLATGRWPYVGDDVLVARLERDPDDPRPYAPFLTEDETEVLMKSLARFRPERFPDGGQLLAALLALDQ